jgi:molybdopterin-containing oxidoreductase family membrane subunit
MRPFFITLIVLLALMLPPYFSVPSAEQVIPGWHTTVFPAYYLPGYVLTAAALLMLGLVLVRRFSGRNDERMFVWADVLGQVMLAAGLVVGLCWLLQLFHGWYSGMLYEQMAFYNRVFAGWWPVYFLTLMVQLIVPHLFWWKKHRRSTGVALFVALLLSGGWILEQLFVFAAPLWK